MDLTMQERGKLTMVKAQACLTAGKTATTAVLDDGLPNGGEGHE
jgi:hypothetical protein